MSSLVPLTARCNSPAPAPAIDGERLVEAFLRGRSPRTTAAYARDLDAFRCHVAAASVGDAMSLLLGGRQGDANLVVLEYRDAMGTKGLAPATINRRLAAVRSAVKLGRLLGMTVNAVEVPGVRSEAYRDVRGPGPGGMQAILDQARRRKGSGLARARGLRDVAALRLTFDLALRRAELLALQLSDLDGDRLWLMRKGKREKIAKTLPAETLKALAAWLKARAVIARGHEFVFVSLSNRALGQPLTADGWYDIVGALGDEVGLRVHPHAIRHASITAAALATGGDMVATQEHSGHANIATARRYVAAAKDTAGKVSAMVANSLV